MRAGRARAVVVAAAVALAASLLGAVPARAAGTEPVPSVSAANPAPGTLTATWPEPANGPADAGYLVRVRAQDSSLVTKVVTTERSASCDVGAGTFVVAVSALTVDGETPEAASAPVVVRAQARSLDVSAAVVRPYRDGFQDSVRVVASSAFPASGSIEVVGPTGRSVRAYPLATGTDWTVGFDGRSATGAALPPGVYQLRLDLDGATVATRTVTVASSQAATPSRRWSAPRLYPVRDGYRDSVQLVVSAGVPATMSVVITAVTGAGKGRVYGKGVLSRRLTGTFTWKGRWRGRTAPAGTYRAVVRVQGGEGSARTASTTIRVSDLRRVVESFDYTVAARKSLQRMAYGGFVAGSDAGGQRLRGCTTAGCQPDMGLYASTLPASVSFYAGVKVTACVRVTSGKPAGRFSYTNAVGGVVGPIYSFAGGGPGCYVPSVAPGTSVTGRTIHWLAANVDVRSRSVIDVAYFRITGRRYVLR
ncbi:MAG: hypothetical protein U0S36_13180 [Candidatus Nanopelagicales bacterium]